MAAEANPFVVAYHPGIDQKTRVRESAMGQMRASGWVTWDEHVEMQEHLAKQAGNSPETSPASAGSDTSAAAGKAASGKEK